MARNEEKAKSMLSRFLQSSRQQNKQQERRPYLAQLCESLPEAEQWRRQVIREITEDISTIANTSLAQETVRELNDRINKRLREKKHWERRIKQLGGTDYHYAARQRQLQLRKEQSLKRKRGELADGPGIDDEFGRDAVEIDGYFYFGAAKDLPAVQSLLNKRLKQEQQRPRSKRELLQHIVPNVYYGFEDERNDPLLLQVEREAEERDQRLAVEEWHRQHPNGVSDATLTNAASDDALTTHDAQQPTRDAELERRRAELLAKYGE